MKAPFTPGITMETGYTKVEQGSMCFQTNCAAPWLIIKKMNTQRFLINVFRHNKQHDRVCSDEPKVHRAALQVVTQPPKCHKSNSLTKASQDKIMQIKLFSSFDYHNLPLHACTCTGKVCFLGCPL